MIIIFKIKGNEIIISTNVNINFRGGNPSFLWKIIAYGSGFRDGKIMMESWF